MKNSFGRKAFQNAGFGYTSSTPLLDAECGKVPLAGYARSNMVDLGGAVNSMQTMLFEHENVLANNQRILNGHQVMLTSSQKILGDHQTILADHGNVIFEQVFPAVEALGVQIQTFQEKYNQHLKKQKDVHSDLASLKETVVKARPDLINKNHKKLSRRVEEVVTTQGNALRDVKQTLTVNFDKLHTDVLAGKEKFARACDVNSANIHSLSTSLKHQQLELNSLKQKAEKELPDVKKQVSSGMEEISSLKLELQSLKDENRNMKIFNQDLIERVFRLETRLASPAVEPSVSETPLPQDNSKKRKRGPPIDLLLLVRATKNMTVHLRSVREDYQGRKIDRESYWMDRSEVLRTAKELLQRDDPSTAFTFDGIWKDISKAHDATQIRVTSCKKQFGSRRMIVVSKALWEAACGEKENQ